MQHKLISIIQRFSFSNLSSLQLFQLVRYATFVLIGIGFAKLHLPLSDIGSFETFILISGMLSFFWVSGIITTMLSVFPKRNDEEKKELLSNTFFSLVFLSIAAGLLLFIFSSNILLFLHKSENENIISLVIVYLLLNCPSFITEYILFLHGRKKEIIYYGFFTFLLTMVLTLLPVVLHLGVAFSLYGLIVVAGIKFLFALFMLNKFATFSISLRVQFSNFHLSLPLLISIFISGSAEYIDGIIVKAKFDDVQFAVFRYGAKELPILLILANTLSTALVPSIANHLNDGLAEIKKKSTQLMHVFFPVTIVLMLLSRYIYQYVFSDSFIFSALIFNIYLLLIIPRVLFPQTVLTGMQKTKFVLLSSVIEIILNVSFSVWLAGKIGLAGIAFGTLIAYSFDKIFLVAINKFVHKIPLSRYLKKGIFCIYSIATCVAFAISYVLLAS